MDYEVDQPFAGARPIPSSDFRIVIGADSAQPYSASVFQHLGDEPVRCRRRRSARSTRARRGGFYHDTGEGLDLAPTTARPAATLWELGSISVCRNDDGSVQ